MDMFAHLLTLEPDTGSWRRQRDAIIERCLPVADRIAWRYGSRGQDPEDLVQVARMGLVHAVTRFDVTRGVHFLGFAVPTIMGEVRRHLRDHAWSVNVPRRMKELNAELGAARDELYQLLGRAPNARELAKHTGVSHHDVVDALIAANGFAALSLDAPPDGGHDNDDGALFDTVGVLDAGLDKVLDVHTVRPLLAALPERERAILVMRFFEDMTQTQIADRIGLSQMHVSRLLSQSLTALRDGARSID